MKQSGETDLHVFVYCGHMGSTTMTQTSSKFLFFVTFYLVASLSGYEHGNTYDLGRGLFNRLHHLDPPLNYSTNTFAEDQWFEQRLDHFNAFNTNVWMQRYFSRYLYKHYTSN